MLHTPHIHTFIFKQSRIHTDTLTGQIIIHRFVSCHSYHFVVYFIWLLALLSFCWFLTVCCHFAVYLMVSCFVLQFCCLSVFSLWLSCCCLSVSLCDSHFAVLCATILLFIWWFFYVLSFRHLFFPCGYHFAVYRFHFVIVVFLVIFSLIVFIQFADGSVWLVPQATWRHASTSERRRTTPRCWWSPTSWPPCAWCVPCRSSSSLCSGSSASWPASDSVRLTPRPRLCWRTVDSTRVVVLLIDSK